MTELANHHSVVFLLDALPPTHVLLLERASWKSFAPNQWTGIGGKYEPGDSILGGAERELQEEADLNVPIHEFARCIINDPSGKFLHYFWGVLAKTTPPACTEGELHWVSKDKLLDVDIIGTTAHVISEWLTRHLVTDRPFTIRLRRADIDDPNASASVQAISEGLLSK